MTTVELSPAYVWDCERCGRENFQRCVSVRLDPEDDADADVIRAHHGLDPHDPIPDGLMGAFQTRPDRVTCRHCNTEFKAADAGTQDEDEE